MLLLSSQEMVTSQVELGAAHYVVKPFTPQEIKDRTETALRTADLPGVGTGALSKTRK